MIKTLEFISRIIVGALFIISGLIKANDPLGFSYKLEEYFAPDVLNLPIFEPIALQLAIFICVVEIVLGIAAIMGSKMKIVSWSLMGLIVFFLFLTFYSAYFNKVTDCGCFGDALKFTPWQSFTKDVILFVFIAIIFWRRNYITPGDTTTNLFNFGFALLFIAIFSIGVISWYFPIWFSVATFALIWVIQKYIPTKNFDWQIAGLATLISLGFSVYCLWHLPLKDFRPYAIGKNIEQGMKTCDELGLPCPKFGYYYTLVNKANGTTKEVTDQEYIASKLWENPDWEITETSDPFTVEKGYEPPVHDFNLFDEDGNELTFDILSYDKVFLLVAYDLTKTNTQAQQSINQFVAAAEQNGIPFIGLTASDFQFVNNFRHEHQSMFPYLSGDAIMLKTIIRSNPGLVYLEKGTVKGKWHVNDFPTFSTVK